MTWRELLATLQSEIQQHTLSTFRDDPGPKGVVVTACPKCRKKFQTIRQFVEHITRDVLPWVIAKVSNGRGEDTQGFHLRPAKLE